MDKLQNLVSHLSDGHFKHAKGNSIEITEKDESAMLRRVNIIGLHEKAVLLMPEKFKMGCFKAKCGASKRCDGVIVCKHDNKLYFVYIDLKTSTPQSHVADNTSVSKQFLATQCLVEYLASVAHHFVPEASLNGKQEERYVVFYQKPGIPSKSTIGPKQAAGTGANVKPMEYKLIDVTNSTNQYFEDLL